MTYHYYLEQVLFNITDAELAVPSLASIDQVDFDLRTDAIVQAPSLTSIEDTEFDVQGGSVFEGSIEDN